jgi:hypothetical protein
MSTERERTLARRWGLVTLALLGLCVVRCLRTCVDELVEMHLRIDPHTLALRMSQLKPAAWKTPALYVYGGLACALVFGAALTVLVLGVRDVMRGDRDD